jgi:hypothetical protein
MTSSMIIIQLLANGKNGSTIYTSLESALYGLGFIFSIEMLFLTIYMAVSIAGVVLNIFGVFILYRPAMNSSSSPIIFSYLRYESIIGVVGNLSCIAMGLGFCPDTVSFENNFAAQWFASYIANPLYNMTVYVKFLIEIVIVVDRIMMLVPTFESRWNLHAFLKIKRPYLVLIGICIFSVLINYPFIYLINAPAIITFINYGSSGFHVYTLVSSFRTPWSTWGNPGYYPMLFVTIFKNLVTFLVETVLNVISLVLFRRHLANRAKLVRPSGHIGRETTTAHQTGQAGESSRESPGGRNMANLVLFISSVTGFVHHSLLLTVVVYAIFYPVPTVINKALVFATFFASNLRHALTFVQFYMFNSAFRKEALAVLASIKRIYNASNNSIVKNNSILTR